MASLPILSVLEQSQVSPPPATVSNTSLPLTFFDIVHLQWPPIHFLIFYDLPTSALQFTETTVPNLKHSLSITLQHFFPYAGNLIVFPDRSKKPEIRYVEGDSVKVTFAECNLDFHHLTGFHPRNCDEFHHLIPSLGDSCPKISDFVKIPVFSLQVTLFPNNGISIGMSIHHSLVDATAQFNFLKAWASINRRGTDESFLANGTLPVYERLIKYPKLDEIYLGRINLKAFNQDYQLPKLSGPTGKLRATFVLKRIFINKLKTWVSTKLPTLPYATSFSVACAYIWCCLAHSYNDQRRLVFYIPTNCRARMDPPIPAAYFGNCVRGCGAMTNATLLTGKEGLITAAELLGESLHKFLSNKDEILNENHPSQLLSDGIPTILISVSGTPKLKLYDVDFGWGKPKKLERIMQDYGASISIDAGRESDQDFEIGVCLTATQMQTFVRVFNLGLEPYI